MRATFLTGFVHSKGFAVVTAIVVLVCAYAFYAHDGVVRIAGEMGFALPSANEWIPAPLANALVSVAVNGLIAVGIYLTGKLYNVLRTLTLLPVSLYLIFQLATPALMLQFYSGGTLCLAIVVCMLLLFSCYRFPDRTRRVFLLFGILSFLSATQYCFLIYIPVFLLGCAQMRILNGRTLVAAIMGIVAPWWILFGFGVISPASVHLPDFVSIFSEIDFHDTLLLLSTLALTAFLALAGFVVNSLKAIAYNARNRAYNGFFSVLTLVTIAAACADFRNMVAYVYLLNLCAAYQTAHYFISHKSDRSYIGVFSIVGVYLAIFVCQTAISIS